MFSKKIEKIGKEWKKSEKCSKIGFRIQSRGIRMTKKLIQTHESNVLYFFSISRVTIVNIETKIFKKKL